MKGTVGELVSFSYVTEARDMNGGPGFITLECPDTALATLGYNDPFVTVRLQPGAANQNQVTFSCEVLYRSGLPQGTMITGTVSSELYVSQPILCSCKYSAFSSVL